jgi:putative inorganic carbon (hco3(-)) transporter
VHRAQCWRSGEQGNHLMSSITFRQSLVSAPMSRRTKVLFALAAVAVLAIAVESAIEAYLGGNKLLLIVPIGAFAGVGMVALGLVNFENFVFTTIALRSSLDITKPQAGNAGSSGVGNPTAAGLDPAGALAVLFILVAFFWLLTRMRSGRKSPPASIHRICLILFAIAGFVSIIDSASPTISLLEAIRVTAVVVMLAVLEVMLVDREMIKRLIAAIYVSAIVPVGVTMFNVLTHHAQFTSGGFARYEGTFSQPNPFAIYLTMLIVMGAALFPHLTQRKKIGMSILLFFSLICLYYTFTRSAWIAAIIGLFAVAIMGRRRLMLGLMVGGIMVSLVALPSIAARFADLGASTSAAGYSSNSLSWRFSYWGDVLPLASKDPITGIGLNMSSFETSQQKEPHNDFLRAYVETGIVGTLAYLALLVSMVLVARHAMMFTKRKAWTYERSVAVGFAACVMAFVVISLVSNVITEVIVLWYYVAFAAAAYAVTRYSENAALLGLPPPVDEPEPVRVGV